jgi:hypothetical protein
MRKRMKDMVLATEIKAQVYAGRIVNKLSEKNGNFIEELLKYILGIVLGGLVLAGLYTLVKNIVLPLVQSGIQNMFNYTA